MLEEVQTILTLRHDVERLQTENNQLRKSLNRFVAWAAAFGAGLDTLAEQEEATLKRLGAVLRTSTLGKGASGE